MRSTGKGKARIMGIAMAMMLASATLTTCSSANSEDGTYYTTIEKARGVYTPASSTKVTLDVQDHTAVLTIDGEEVSGTINRERGLLETDSGNHPFQFHKNGNITMTFDGTLMRFTKVSR